MKLWLAWMHWEDVMGVYDSREKAVECLNEKCQDKRHADGHTDCHSLPGGCCIQSTELNEFTETYAIPE